jgi:hypothetical protein
MNRRGWGLGSGTVASGGPGGKIEVDETQLALAPRDYFVFLLELTATQQGID